MIATMRWLHGATASFDGQHWSGTGVSAGVLKSFPVTVSESGEDWPYWHAKTVADALGAEMETPQPPGDEVPDDVGDDTELTYRSRLAFMLGNPHHGEHGEFASEDSSGKRTISMSPADAKAESGRSAANVQAHYVKLGRQAKLLSEELTPAAGKRVVTELRTSWNAMDDRFDTMKEEMAGIVARHGSVPVNSEPDTVALAAVYHATQDWFRANNVQTVRMYRGLILDANRVPETDTGKTIALTSQAAESWSTDVDVALRFANMGTVETSGKYAKNRVLMAVDIPVSRIAAGAVTGIGSVKEREFVAVVKGLKAKAVSGATAADMRRRAEVLR